MNKLLALICIFPICAIAQFNINTNLVLISGGSVAAENGLYQWTTNGTFYNWSGNSTRGFTNLSGNGARLTLSPGGAYGDYYLQITNPTGSFAPDFATTASLFPGGWTPVGASAPAPLGAYWPPIATNWSTVTTNFWTFPGDRVAFHAFGLNLSSANSNQLIVAIGSNVVFVGPWTRGLGMSWTLDGKIQYDGTNLYSKGTFVSGDTNTPMAYDVEEITNAAMTNAWQWCVLGDTNGLTFAGASIAASRSPIGDVPVHSFVPAVALLAPGGVVYAPWSWSLAAITNTMPNFGIWQGNSNGSCLVTLSLSNGVVRYLQVLR